LSAEDVDPETTNDNADPWQNRIEGQGVEVPTDILPNPSNWRTHSERQKHTMQAVLDTVGWVQRCIVNRTTGHLVDGHLRCALAIENGEKQIPVVYVSLTEEEEALVLATLDPLGAMAGIDPERLESLLETVQSDDLAISALLDDLADAGGISAAADEEDKAIGDSTAVKEVTIAYNLVFDDEDQQQRWYEFLRGIRNEYPEAGSVAARLMAYFDSIGIIDPPHVPDEEEEEDVDEVGD